MLKNYLLITVRALLKNKVYIFINVLGLAVAIASCIVAYFNYDHNASFDGHHVNRESIYRVNSVREFQNQLTTYGYVPLPLGDMIRQNVGDVDAVTRYYPGGSNMRIKDDVFSTGLTYVDENFFDLFTFDFVEGSGAGLKSKTNILISETLAKKYFGNEKAVGKMITQILPEGGMQELEIGGVFKNQPSNSSFGSSAYTRFDNWFDIDSTLLDGTNWKSRITLFIQVGDPSRIASIESQIKPYVENNNKVREDFIMRSFVLDPLVGMGVRDSYEEKPGTWTSEGSPIAAVVGMGMMGIIILLIACFNLTNTTIAISSRRLKEIGLRKVMGGLRKQLIFQFLSETLLVSFVALLLGVVIAEWFLIPEFNKMWGGDGNGGFGIDADYFGRPNFLIFMVSILLVTSVIAGGYPALYISKFEPAVILKGKAKLGGTNIFTWALLTMQLAFSLVGIVASIGFSENAKYQRDFDLGFNQDGVVYCYVENQSGYDTYRNALASIPNVNLIAGTQHHIYSNYYNDPIKYLDQEIETDILNVGEDYLDAVGFTLTEGRNFMKDSETDKKESVIITDIVAQKFGWDDPLGKELIWMDTVKLYVIGVVKNVYTNGLWRELQPMVLRYESPDKYQYLLVNAPIVEMTSINKEMEAKWKEVFPNKMYNARYLNEAALNATRDNINIVKMFAFLGFVALGLTATGLFTLVSLNILRRMKEIGVRKTLGASIGNIAAIINKEFAVILIIAAILGSIGGKYLAGWLMSSIWKYYMAPNTLTLIISSGLLFVIATLTVGFKVYNAARMNPVNTLRDE